MRVCLCIPTRCVCAVFKYIQATSDASGSDFCIFWELLGINQNAMPPWLTDGTLCSFKVRQIMRTLSIRPATWLCICFWFGPKAQSMAIRSFVLLQL